MGSLLAVWKFLCGLWHVLMGMWTIYVRFPQLSPEQREMRVQAWALQFLALWGVHLRVLGQPVVNGPTLMVANHISWLDILVIHAARQHVSHPNFCVVHPRRASRPLVWHPGPGPAVSVPSVTRLALESIQDGAFPVPF